MNEDLPMQLDTTSLIPDQHKDILLILNQSSTTTSSNIHHPTSSFAPDSGNSNHFHFLNMFAYDSWILDISTTNHVHRSNSFSRILPPLNLSTFGFLMKPPSLPTLQALFISTIIFFLLMFYILNFFTPTSLMCLNLQLL